MKVSIAMLGVLIACGPPPRHHVGDDDDNPDAGSPDAGGADAFVYPDAGTNCAAGTELIYTIDEGTEELSTFDPATGTFDDLGWLSCSVPSGSRPNSMAIDRQAHAWVAYGTGQLFKVDLPGLSCTSTTWAPPPGVTRFGMGFSTDTPGGTTETLYIAGGATPRLWTIDLTTMTTTPVGPIPAWAEMTGTGSAELWGFMPASSNTRVVQFDKATAGIVTSYPLPELNEPFPTYAFAHWGGDYWVFLQRSTEWYTTVYQVDGTTGVIEGSVGYPNRTIIGAGVSTCAPVVIE